jgi:hypothetical protein
MIAQQLRALREMALAQAAIAETLLAGMSPPPSPPKPAEPVACEHPEDQRLSTARMGHPTAFQCRACGQEVG